MNLSPTGTGSKLTCNMMRLVACFCVSTLAVSCLLAGWAKPSAQPAQKTDVLTVFLTGNELGELKPCGCSGGQLGGLDKRSAILDSVPKQKRLIVDTGSLIEGDSEQDLIKFDILIQAFGLLDYDLVNLTKKDIETAQNRGLLDSIGSVLNIISPYGPTDANVPVKFTKQFPLNDKIVTITIAAFNAESMPREKIEELFPPRSDLPSVNILILDHSDVDIISSITEDFSVVDYVVCPPEADEPLEASEPNERPLVFSVGRFGRYVSKLEIKAADDEDGVKLSFSAIPVSEDLPQNPSLVRLYKDYQQLVKNANLLEQYLRLPLSNSLEYTGSKSCKLCHNYEYEKWSSKAHAHAYATLEKVGSQYDPECVVCHVVGMDYDSGFISEEKTSHLKDVGCENCHGPGSEHNKSLGIEKTTEPKSSCTECHTPEQSVEYAGNEQLYLEKIVHWQEPKPNRDVKEKGDSNDL